MSSSWFTWVIKSFIAINPPLNTFHTSLHYELTFPIMLATFCSRSGNPLCVFSCGIVIASCPKSFKKYFIYLDLFNFGEEPEVARCQTRWMKLKRTHCYVFTRLSFCCLTVGGFTSVFLSLRDSERALENCVTKQEEGQDVLSEGQYAEEINDNVLYCDKILKSLSTDCKSGLSLV